MSSPERAGLIIQLAQIRSTLSQYQERFGHENTKHPISHLRDEEIRDHFRKCGSFLDRADEYLADGPIEAAHPCLSFAKMRLTYAIRLLGHPSSGVAESVQQLAVNQEIAGSSPAAGAKK